MGTRGAVGFILKGENYITFNSMDSYPSGLGKEVIEFIKENNLCELKETVSELKVVDDNAKPTPREFNVCASIYNKSTAPDSWFELLQGLNGIEALVKVPYMLDYSYFLYDSLFCEWAYIVNFDTKKLEVYKGANKTIGKGRYADIPDNMKETQVLDNGNELPWSGYYGVRLIKQYSLKYLQSKKGLEVIDKIDLLGSDWLKSVPNELYKLNKKSIQFEQFPGIQTALELFDLDTSSDTSDIVTRFISLLYDNREERVKRYNHNIEQLAELNRKSIFSAYEVLKSYFFV